MGLDITYVKLGKKIDVDGEDDQPLSINYDNLLRLNNDYDWEQSDDIEGGYYEYESIGEFRAGSYSAYAYFKDKLGLLAELAMSENEELSEKYKDTEPFEAIVDFTDSDGFIGPWTSSKLMEVFNDFNQPIILNILRLLKYGGRDTVDFIEGEDNINYIIETYQMFKTAFTEVSKNGVVVFN